MSKHQEKEINLDKSYEEDVVNFKGILYFCGGLTLLIIVTFGLMWILQYRVLLPQADGDDANNLHPLALNQEERLPPEPRLQSAPGFGVEGKNGRINLELREPQAEWNELKKQYEDIWENGEKGEDGKTIIALPIKEAQEKLLKSGSIKSVAGEEGKKVLNEANRFISGSSAGRIASETRR